MCVCGLEGCVWVVRRVEVVCVCLWVRRVCVGG